MDYALTENDLRFADQLLGYSRRLVKRIGTNAKVVLEVRCLVSETGLRGQVRFVIPGAPVDRRGFLVEIHRCPGGYRASSVAGGRLETFCGLVLSDIEWLLTKVDAEIDFLMSQNEVVA